ncbi:MULTISPECIES: hypothetical protein [Virgibacillus]|uniref:Uncharacterized protein n=1 Tax=Virgibacillus dokdonensis TaxID=302167 RepID=A0A2K9IVR1_9BACI|nr:MULTISPECIES: hypothetical protein [Virgibacillus]AUJ23869.1 hypothetical protein A21D_00757 [Virgibacillus dokdonensis]NWO12325.1 hypothetical protein [Virgibacillus sp.]
MSVLAYLPLFILLLFVAIVFGVLKLSKHRFRHYHQYVKFIFLGYVILLLIAAGISFFVPYNEVVKRQAKNSDIVLYNYFAGDRHWQDVDSSYQQKQWEFSVSSNQPLHIVSPDGSMDVYVERTGDLQNKIDIRYFQSPHFINGINVMQFIEEDVFPIVTFKDSQLTIWEPQSIEKNVYTIQSELPFKQFSEERNLSDGAFRNGERILLIRASEDIEIKADGNITYMNQ